MSQSSLEGEQSPLGMQGDEEGLPCLLHRLGRGCLVEGPLMEYDVAVLDLKL